MSQFTQAEEIKEASRTVIELYALLATTTLLPIYEYVITFDQEVAAVWARDKKLSFGSLLLVSTRWCIVLAAVISRLPGTTTSCERLVKLSLGLAVVAFVQVAVFSALRVSAIWGRNWIIFSVALVLGLAPVATNTFEAFHLTYTFEEGTRITGEDLPERTRVICPNRETSMYGDLHWRPLVAGGVGHHIWTYPADIRRSASHRAARHRQPPTSFADDRWGSLFLSYPFR